MTSLSTSPSSSLNSNTAFINVYKLPTDTSVKMGVVSRSFTFVSGSSTNPNFLKKNVYY